MRLALLGALALLSVPIATHAQLAPGAAIGAAPPPIFYGTVAPQRAVKCVTGQFLTGTGGTVTVPLTSATFPGFPGFTAAPTSVKPQPLSTGTTSTTLYQGYVTALSATSISVAVYSGTTVVVGGSSLAAAPANVTVELEVCGP